MRKALLLCFVAMLIAANCYAATTNVTLAWDANTESDLAGYKIYQSHVSGGPYVIVSTLGRVTTTTINGVLDGQACWVATAYDAVGNESRYSNEVCLQLDTTPPSVPQNLSATGLVRVQ